MFSLACYPSNFIISGQVYDILTNLTLRCYEMVEPRPFFDLIMESDTFNQLVLNSCDSIDNQKQGLEMLRLLIHNLFVASSQRNAIR